MKTVAATHHLIRRGDVWYFKRRVPTPLVERAKSPVLQYSLRTTDKAEAKRLARIEDLKADRWFADLEAGTAAATAQGGVSASRSVTLDELIEHARDYVTEENDRRAKRFLVNPPETDEERGYLVDDVIGEQQELSAPERSPVVGKVAAAIAGRAGLGEDQNPAALLGLAARALGELARMQNDRLAGDYSATHHDAMFAPRPAGTEKPKVGGMSFRQLGAAYVVFKKSGKWADTTEADMERVRTLVHRVIDPDMPAREISIDDVRKVRDAIATMPIGTIRPTKKKSEEQRKTVSAATAEKYYRFFRAILRWGVDEGHLAAMPGAGVKLAAVPSSEGPGREPYSPDQLRTIFSSPLFTGCESAALTRRHKPGSKIIKDGWYWLPLIGAYTGMRIGEIVQLLSSDLKAENGIMYFHVVGGVGKRVKTTGSVRRIPVPQVLFDLGIGDVIAKAPKEGRLFPEIPIGKGNGNSAVATQWWTRYGRAAGFYTEKTTFHSFRHSFTDALRDAEVLDYIQHALTGHKTGSVHEGYGLGPSLVKTKEAIDKVHYPSIDLSKIGKT